MVFLGGFFFERSTLKCAAFDMWNDFAAQRRMQLVGGFTIVNGSDCNPFRSGVTCWKRVKNPLNAWRFGCTTFLSTVKDNSLLSHFYWLFNNAEREGSAIIHISGSSLSLYLALCYVFGTLNLSGEWTETLGSEDADEHEWNICTEQT